MLGKIVGNFELLEKLHTGSDGSTCIYIGKHTTESFKAAVKIFLSEQMDNKLNLRNFLHEQQITRYLDHPYVVKVYETGDEQNLYIAMEYIKGGNLRNLIKAESPLVRQNRLSLIKAITEAIHYIHNCDVIHRDIKPRNILILGKNRIKLIDFGLAISKSFWNEGKRIRTGTPTYMSPEQIQGLRGDERTDIYSFGITMYEVLTGSRPFSGDNFETLSHQHLKEIPTPPSKRAPYIVSELDQIVMKSIEKDPKNRYQTMEELMEELGKIRLNV